MPATLPQGPGLLGVLRRETNLKCLILTSLIIGCVSTLTWCRLRKVTKVHIDFDAFPITREAEISACENSAFILPASFVLMLYLLYLVECNYSKTWVMLRQRKLDVPQAYTLLDEWRQAVPVVWWKATSYHYVRRTREIARIHNGQSYPTTQVLYERVNSHLAKGTFYFGHLPIKDASPVLVGLENHLVTRIRLSKAFVFGNPAASEEFQEQRNTFFQDQARLDDYLEMREGLEIGRKSWQDEVIVWSRQPWCFSRKAFWISNCLLLSWLFRFLLNLNTAHASFQVTKVFGEPVVTPGSSRRRTPRTITPQRITPSIIHPVETALHIIQNPLSNGEREEEERAPLLLHLEDQHEEKHDDDGNDENDNLPTIPSYNHPSPQLFTSERRLQRSVTLLMTKGDQRMITSMSRRGEVDYDSSVAAEDLLVPTYSQALLWNNGQQIPGLSDPIPGVPIRLQSPVVVTLPQNQEDHNNSSPPSYEEALRSSRPLFLSRLAAIRRCFTERDIASFNLTNFSSHSSTQPESTL